MDILLDGKLKCISILTRMTVSDYLGLVEKAYSNRGGISGQREALKQKTAISIRNRMIEDIKGGTILPPDTINNVSENLKSKSDEEVLDYIDFGTLNQKMERKMSKVGDYERELFYEAFKVLVDENGEVNTLGICWRAI